MFNTRCSSFFMVKIPAVLLLRNPHCSMVKVPGHGLGFAASDAPQTRELWSQTGTSVEGHGFWTGIWRFTGIYGDRIGCWSHIKSITYKINYSL